jgi:hypothetical protein
MKNVNEIMFKSFYALKAQKPTPPRATPGVALGGGCSTLTETASLYLIGSLWIQACIWLQWIKPEIGNPDFGNFSPGNSYKKRQII